MSQTDEDFADLLEDEGSCRFGPSPSRIASPAISVGSGSQPGKRGNRSIAISRSRIRQRAVDEEDPTRERSPLDPEHARSTGH